MKLGNKITYYKKIDSTQLEVFRKIEKGTIQNGEVIVADIQTNGKRNTWKKMVHRRSK